MNTTIDLLIQEVDQAHTPVKLVQTVHALADSRSEKAIPTLIAALGYNNPGAAIAAMHGLVSMGRNAVESLINLMDDYNYGARAYTVRALAMIGDPRSLSILINCAESDFAPSVRRAAIKGLGSIHWEWTNWNSEIISETQVQILDSLQSILKDTDWSFRYAAIVALDSISKAAYSNRQKAIALLETAQAQEPDLAVKFRAHVALQNLQALSC